MSCLELAKADSEASLIQGSPARRQLLYFRRRRLAEGPKTSPGTFLLGSDAAAVAFTTSKTSHLRAYLGLPKLGP